MTKHAWTLKNTKNSAADNGYTIFKMRAALTIKPGTKNKRPAISAQVAKRVTCVKKVLYL